MDAATEAAYAAWAGALVTLVGVAVTVWLTWRNRSAGHRETLYAKQLEMFDSVFHLLAQALRETVTIFDDKEAEALARQTFIRLDQELIACAFIAPADKTIDDLTKVLLAFNACLDAPKEDRKALQGELVLKIARACNSARNSLGIDPLSNEIVKAIGVYTVSSK